MILNDKQNPDSPENNPIKVKFDIYFAPETSSEEQGNFKNRKVEEKIKVKRLILESLVILKENILSQEKNAVSANPKIIPKKTF